MTKPVNLAVHRAKQAPPHVRVELSAWYLGDGCWYYEPVTLSRMGDLTAAGWETIGRAVGEYGAELVEHGRPGPKRGARKVWARRGRR